MARSSRGALAALGSLLAIAALVSADATPERALEFGAVPQAEPTKTYPGCKCIGTNHGVAENKGYNEKWGKDTYGSSCDKPWDNGERYCMDAPWNYEQGGGTYVYNDGTKAEWCSFKWCYVNSLEHCPDDAVATDFFAGTQHAGLVYSVKFCDGK